ncbi:MAG: hypothetical protein ACOX8B_03515 [Lachnospiraceae bacterium]|jgi:hypothetical protein
MIEEPLRSTVKEQIQKLIQTGPCCRELREEGRKWLSEAPSEAGDQALIQELKEDLGSIEGTLAFFESDAAAQYLGSREAADAAAAAEKKRLAAGEKYCDCEACSIVYAVLKELNEI